MITTTELNRPMINEENMLIRSDDTYNQEIHIKLSRIIHNIASKYAKSNATASIEDLKQEAWVKIYEAIKKNKDKGKSLEISYLVMVAKNAILAECMNIAHKREYIDDFCSTLMSSADNGNGDNHNQLNVAKARMEFNILSHRVDESNATDLRVSLENALDNLEDDRARILIVLRYIKEFNGESQKIHNMYIEFYNTLSDEKKALLDNASKFTNNLAYQVMGMRATDNCTTKIRSMIKEVLLPLYC